MIRTCLNQSTKNTEAHKGNMEQWAVANEEFQKWQTTGLLAFSKLKLFPLLMLPWLSNYYFSCFSFFFFSLWLYTLFYVFIYGEKELMQKYLTSCLEKLTFEKRKHIQNVPVSKKSKTVFNIFFFFSFMFFTLVF